MTLVGSVLQVLGLVCVCVAAFALDVVAGFAVTGVATFAVGYALERRG